MMTTIDDCPEVPNEVNDSIQITEKIVMKTSPIKEAWRGMTSPSIIKQE